MADDPPPGPLSGSRSWVPVPDPTDRTVADLRREIDAVKERMAHDTKQLTELFGSRLDGIVARIDGNDKAVELLRTSTDRIPEAIDGAVFRLRELHEEKFRSIEIQFRERDIRTDQTSRDTKTAVDAALKAQQEAFSEQNKSSALAINKSEASTTKQIDQIGATISLLAKAIDDKVADIKDRINKIEGVALGVMTQKVDATQATTAHTQGTGLWVAIAGFGLAVILALERLIK